jgi:hypothetical protein
VAAAQFNAAEKVINAQIAANQDSQWLMQQWLGSQELPTSYPTQGFFLRENFMISGKRQSYYFTLAKKEKKERKPENFFTR